jgi:hypothetical protein
MLDTDAMRGGLPLTRALRRELRDDARGAARLARESETTSPKDANARANLSGRHLPLEPNWREVWLTVTPVWAVLAMSRVLFYWLERLRYPEIIPPVSADAITILLLWPLVVLGCHVTLAAWRRAGVAWTVAVALASSLLIGALARPTYAVATYLNSSGDASQGWLGFFLGTSRGFWYAWLANAVEYGVLYLSCVAAAVGFLSFRSLMNERLLRTRVEAAAAQERLRALRTQLNPHFLFNTLNSIVSLSDDQSPSAQQLITQFSDLLRRTLRASEREEHPLAEELAYVEVYLRIQKVRQPSRIDWHVRINAPSTSVAVPSLILLPLVENAVTHGLRGGAAKVDIAIGVERDRDDLVIELTNSCSQATPAPGVRPGLGLRNVRERLDVMFGARALLIARRVAPDRFAVRITLPQRERAGSGSSIGELSANPDRR